jgi:hypothetical protein
MEDLYIRIGLLVMKKLYNTYANRALMEIIDNCNSCKKEINSFPYYTCEKCQSNYHENCIDIKTHKCI